MISFIMNSLPVLLVELMGVAAATGVMYAYWKLVAESNN